MNAPCTFILKNNGITQFYDVSYLNFNRNGDKSSLIQNRKESSYYKSLKYLKNNVDLSNYVSYCNKYRFKYDIMRMYLANSDNPKYLKELGTISKNQISKYKKAINCLVSMVTLSKSAKKYKGQYLSFLTLTLPSKQVHHDNVLRRSLSRLLDNLTKTYNVTHYIWKAEAQRNGNIHFHLLIDKYIHYSVLQKLWNRQLDKIGYLDTFCEKHGHRNPHTTEAKSLRNIKNPSKYLLKYLTKSEPFKRPILGRLMGMANATKSLDYPKFSEGNEFFYYVNNILSKGLFKCVLSEDFYSHHVGETFKILRIFNEQLWTAVKEHYYNLNGFFKEKKNIEEKEFVRAEKKYTYDDWLKELAEEKELFKIKRNKKALQEFKRKYLSKFCLVNSQNQLNILFS